MRCNNCNSKNHISNVFCVNCGSRIAEAGIYQLRNQVYKVNKKAVIVLSISIINFLICYFLARFVHGMVRVTDRTIPENFSEYVFGFINNPDLYPGVFIVLLFSFLPIVIVLIYLLVFNVINSKKIR